MRVKLPTVSARSEGLGMPTIMDRALASRHGATYVHLAVFAIDVDRVRDALDDVDSPHPFAWEVFLLERYLVDRVDPNEHRALIEDAVLGVLEGEPGEPVMGSQLPFAVWDAIARGVWPDEMRSMFRGWKARPKELVAALAPLWADADRTTRDLAQLCLDTPMQPPLAPPTLETLRAMIG
ncbi:hypothetical protein [Sandaracinus amylolyticus]|uniref:hypothetical protein n=1 Tax=Sandaracinus amylolyticus TaxID=927083 RepID=UPI001F3ECC6E|nr:hypothetical protein [Sandaracinus amylolyticus]UJR82533.1 Hypothetical protein I5071_45980 [Sandaracinus amylolyticus]